MKSQFELKEAKRKKPVNDHWVLTALQKQSALILDAVKEIGGKCYAEEILKHLNGKGHDFDLPSRQGVAEVSFGKRRSS